MVFVPGIITVVIFYIMVVIVGIWAARKFRVRSDTETEDVMLAGRNIGVVVGAFTMTATWVGGGYILGTAEVIYTSGLVWCQAPFAYALSLAIGGTFFAKRMRDAQYVTMLDPFQIRFGDRMCGLLFVVALFGEICWSAAILSALGGTLNVIIDVGQNVAVISSAIIAMLYTLIGGLYSVAYTDVMQLICIVIGLWICVPYIMMNQAAQSISSIWSQWRGEVLVPDIAVFIDGYLLLIIGGIPWQVYFQRVLSCKKSKDAQMLSYMASGGCLLMAIPSILIGAAGKATDWSLTAYPTPDGTDLAKDDIAFVLPQALHNLCPPWAAALGLGSVSAAVMSSSDSSILAASTMFTHNVCKPLFWQNMSERQSIWVIRVSVFLIGSISCVLALTVKSVYGLWFLCSDLVYVILAPQLFCVVYLRWPNTYGSLAGYVLGLFFRLGGGEANFQWEGFIPYPKTMPFKTFAMLVNLCTMLTVSIVTSKIFKSDPKWLRFDIFKCYQRGVHQENSLNLSAIREVETTIPVYDLVEHEGTKSCFNQGDSDGMVHDKRLDTTEDPFIPSKPA